MHRERKDHHSSNDEAVDDSELIQGSDNELSDISNHPKRVVRITERAKYVYCVL